MNFSFSKQTFREIQSHYTLQTFVRSLQATFPDVNSLEIKLKKFYCCLHPVAHVAHFCLCRAPDVPDAFSRRVAPIVSNYISHVVLPVLLAQPVLCQSFLSLRSSASTVLSCTVGSVN